MSTEYRFYCPEQQREVSTGECYDRGNGGRACYGEFCDHVEYAICRIAQAKLTECFGTQISVEHKEPEGLLCIRFHENLTLEAYYDRLFRTIGFDAYLKDTHGHDFPAENVDGLVCIVGDLLRGEKAFVVQQSGLFGGGSLRLADRKELIRMWRKYTRGCRTLIIDGRGVHEKEAYAHRPK